MMSNNQTGEVADCPYISMRYLTCLLFKTNLKLSDAGDVLRCKQCKAEDIKDEGV